MVACGEEINAMSGFFINLRSLLRSGSKVRLLFCFVWSLISSILESEPTSFPIL